MKCTTYLTVLMLLITVTSAKGLTRNVPGDFPTIQLALNACFSGDTVLVQPGTYNENITWPTAVNGIKLLSAAGQATTIISANGSGRVMHVNSLSIDTNTVIRGFTIMGGNITSGSGYGAGIYINNSSVILEDMLITGNRVYVPGGHGYGAGINLTSSSSVLRNCRIVQNFIDSATWCYGAGLYISGGTLSLTDVEISGNFSRAENWCYGVGLYARNGANFTLTNARVTGNGSGDNAIWYYGNGIYVNDVTATFVNVLVASNKSGAAGSFNYGGGIYFDGDVCNVSLMNVTVTDNSKTGLASITGSGIYSRDASVNVTNSILYNFNNGSETGVSGSGVLSVQYSNVRGGAFGTGNLNIIPGFVSATDFHLAPTSPCAGVGTATGAPVFDLDNMLRPQPAATMPDMGCYEVDQSSTSLDDLTVSTSAIFAYPNPVVKGFAVNIHGITEEELIVSDSHGRIIYSTRVADNKHEVQTIGWAAGLYVVMNANATPVKILVVE